jgi:Tol biopolymer transport system component
MRRLFVLAGVLALTAVSSAGAGRPEVNGEIAFVSDRRGADNLYAVQPDGSGLRELTHSFAAAGDLHVSRDRRLVAFARFDDLEKTEIWAATTRGTNPRRIVAGRGRVLNSNMQPAWSPDGRRLAFIRQDNEEDLAISHGFCRRRGRQRGPTDHAAAAGGDRAGLVA